ncbi:hypothetical protein DFH09DRAFT_1101032 [Mycena vulgaris]|nr:hypothetical protein DFH09DRAFT_1101032 [Mycena vulgaris]
MLKRKSRSKNSPDPAASYTPGISAEEKAARHRKAVAEHYARNPEIRERRRKQVAEKRAAVKANKRRWDPPKKTLLPPDYTAASGDAASSEQGRFFDPRADSTVYTKSWNPDPEAETPSEVGGAVGTALTSPGRAECDALAAPSEGEAAPLAEDQHPHSAHSVDSVLERAMCLSSLDNELVPQLFPAGFDDQLSCNGDLHTLPPGVTPLSAAQTEQMKAGTLVLTPVQAAQIRVAENNAAQLTPPTSEEKARWVAAPRIGAVQVVYFGYSRGRHLMMEGSDVETLRATEIILNTGQGQCKGGHKLGTFFVSLWSRSGSQLVIHQAFQDFSYQQTPRLDLTMAPPPWTTPEELEWLQSKMPEYLILQAETKLWNFWAPMQGGWFRKFPEESRIGLPGVTEGGDAPDLTPEQSSMLTEAVKARKGQLENWFRHHSKKTKTVAAVQRSSTDSLDSLLFKKEVRKRVHHPAEVWQKLHPAEVAAALRDAGYFELNEEHASGEANDWVNESDSTKLARIKAHQSKRMRVWTRVVAALFDQATDEEKASIHEIIEAERKELEEEKQKRKGGDGEQRPEQYQQAIDETAEVVAKLHKIIGAKTGWYGFTVLGGPNPRFGGGLSMKVVSFGRTPAGNDFQAAHGSFDESITIPFQAFLKRSFSAAEREARALTQLEETEAVLPSLDPLFRLPPDVPTPLVPAKRVKPKRMHKKKKQSKSVTGTTASSDDTASAIPPSSSPHFAPLPPASTSPERTPEIDDFDAGYIADDAPNDVFSDSNATRTTMWPAGMSVPPSPRTAAAVALAERGVEGGATYMNTPPPPVSAVIDPVLLATPERPTAARPSPRPLPAGAGPRPFGRAGSWGTHQPVSPTPFANVNGFNFPLAQSHQAVGARMSTLFADFRAHAAASPVRTTPNTTQDDLHTRAQPLSLSGKALQAPSLVGTASTSVIHMHGAVPNRFGSRKTVPRTPADSGGSAPLTATSVSTPTELTANAVPMPTPTVPTPTVIPTPTAQPTPTAHVTAIPTTSTTSTAPPTSAIPAAPAADGDPSSPVPIPPVFIRSRPMAKRPVVAKPKPPAAPKSKAKAAQRKPAAVAAAGRAAAKEKAEKGKRKVVSFGARIADGGDDDDDASTNDTGGVLAETTNVGASTTEPILAYSCTNTNRDRHSRGGRSAEGGSSKEGGGEGGEHAAAQPRRRETPRHRPCLSRGTHAQGSQESGWLGGLPGVDTYPCTAEGEAERAVGEGAAGEVGEREREETGCGGASRGSRD